MGSTNLSILVKCLEEMGYALEHTWQESHGDGGAHYFEDDAGRTRAISYNREGQATDIRNERSQNRRLAREILADVAKASDPDHCPRWVAYSSHKVSQCATAGWTDYIEVQYGRKPYTSADVAKGWASAYRVAQIAGHGATAAKLTAEDLDAKGDW